ncbi:MAG TPA: adenosylcobinamide amidohydrolase [Micromonosporaceae bacterium]|jgi:adenosylcobinamide amidohydrolase|nr:adenosylcobinamide amidohydrolase [Micromonosporaceae bacterium]
MTVVERIDAGLRIPVLVWRMAAPELAISSGPLGGGLGLRTWALNATVPMDYRRTDPDVHLAEIAADLDLVEPGVAMMTGVDVREHLVRRDTGVAAVVTVGLGAPTWAAAGQGQPVRCAPGTINCLVRVPVRLSDAALVNAVATVAEAKAQALWELGVEATGTATDATCVTCLANGPIEAYGGPRSTWGARIARVVHEAVRDGGRAWLDAGRSWSDSVAAPGSVFGRSGDVGSPA